MISSVKLLGYHIYAGKKVTKYNVFIYFIHVITACNSTNGLTCLEIIKEVPVITPEIIAVIVIVAVAIIVLIVIIIFLLWLWKYQNDAFYRYILCCVYGGSKTQINNLKQENIRLRNELSQQKLNLNASGRFQGLCMLIDHVIIYT